MKKDRLIFFVFVIVLSLLTYISLQIFNPKRAALSEAKILLKEFKSYKAIEVLKQAKKQIRKGDKELDAYIIYALIKAKEFREAKSRIKKLETFPYLDKKELEDLIAVLSENEENEVMIELLSKLNYANLDENFFVDLSAEKNSIINEIKILDAGINYLRRIKIQNRKKFGKPVSLERIQEYYVSRAIDIGNIYLANEDYDNAKLMLEKPIEMGILDSSDLKDKLYFDLAFTHEKLGNQDQTRKYLEISAKLGNSEAREVLESMGLQ